MASSSSADGAPALDAALLGVPVRLLVPADVQVAVADRLRALIDGAVLRPGGEPVELVIETDANGYRVRGSELRDADASALAVAAVTAATVTRSPLLCMHAGVVSTHGAAVAIPGESGHGKTTLVAALMQAGFGYVSDEVLAVDRTTRAVTPFRRPLGLAADVWELLDLDPALRPAPGAERILDPATFGHLGRAARVRHVVLSRRSGGAATLSAAPRAAAVPALLRASFNHYRDAASSFHVAVELAREAQVWHATYSSAGDLAALLADELGADQT